MTLTGPVVLPISTTWPKIMIGLSINSARTFRAGCLWAGIPWEQSAMSGNASIDELGTRWEESHSRGEEISAADLCRDHPELLEALRQALAQRRSERGGMSVEELSATADVPPNVTNDVARAGDAAADGLGPPQGSCEITRLGPFRVVKLLGEGGMGVETARSGSGTSTASRGRS
jgi:hypothetical protein